MKLKVMFLMLALLVLLALVWVGTVAAAPGMGWSG
jgi:hypothetical protein